MPKPDDIESVGIITQFDESEATQAMLIKAGQPAHNAEDAVIDLEKNKEEGPTRKEMAPRSEMSDHFIKIKDDKGNVKAARCKYCHHELKVDIRGHGTLALKKHFGTCKHNPHVSNKDPNQGTLQATIGEAPTTWRFDQEKL